MSVAHDREEHPGLDASIPSPCLLFIITVFNNFKQISRAYILHPVINNLSRIFLPHLLRQGCINPYSCLLFVTVFFKNFIVLVFLQHHAFCHFHHQKGGLGRYMHAPFLSAIISNLRGAKVDQQWSILHSVTHNLTQISYFCQATITNEHC